MTPTGVYYTTDQVAAVLSRPDDPWSTERARRWLLRAGAAVKRNGRWVTTPDRLREHFPEVYNKIATAAF